MSEKIYRVQMNSKGMPNFSTAVEIADRPQGEWVSDYSSPVAYRCTACNTLQHWSVIQNGRYRFCPNCGARLTMFYLPTKEKAIEEWNKRCEEEREDE